MTKAIFKGFVASLVVAIVVLPACAAEDPPQPYVVLVGIGKYQDEQIKPRSTAEADAKALYDVLSNRQYFDGKAEHIRLLLGTADPERKSEPATHENIIKALTWAASSARRDDPVIFAFIGQGGPIGDRACYFASDSTFKDRAKNAVTAGEISHALENLKSERFLGLIDINFKGFVPGKEPVLEPNRETLFREFLGPDEEADPDGRLLFLATNGLRQSIDAGDLGLFAKIIVEGLKGGADKEGYEPDGLVTLKELADFLNKELPARAAELGKTRQERQQVHHIIGSLWLNFVLTRHPEITPKVEERLAAMTKLAAGGSLSKELAEEAQELLGRMPRLKAYQELRKSYQQLADGTLSAEDLTKKRAEILEPLKLKRSAALAYAAKIIQATQVVRESYVKEVSQGELVGWAIRGLYERIGEKIPRDIQERLSMSKGNDEQQLTSLLADMRERLGQRDDLHNHKDIDYALQRMLRRLDRYTTYIDPEMLQRFQQDTTGKFTGIGIQISRNALKDMIEVITPIKGSPAYKQGLKAGDIITSIIREEDSSGKKLEKPEILSTKGLAIDQAVKKIQGKAGTKVKLAIEREGADEPLDFEITRDEVEVETVLGAKRQETDDWDFWIDPANKIAYVRLTIFARNSARDMGRVVSRLKKQGIKGLILDLRFNPGGLLPTAVEISDMFIDDGLIVTIKQRAGRELSYTGDSYGSQLDFPMVCLVNKYSASGSEIVAACLQDHRRAIVIGERTYGKGSVQTIQPFEQGELKLTTQSWWRPTGRNMNRASTSGKEDEDWGVIPDKGFVVSLEPRERDQLHDHQRGLEMIPRRDVPAKEQKPEFQDRQLDVGLKYLRGQIKVASQAPVKKAG